MLATEALDLTRTQNSPTAPGIDRESVPLSNSDPFPRRHIGPSADETSQMLQAIGYSSLDALIDAAGPPQIRLKRSLQLPAGRGKDEGLSPPKDLARHD